MADVKDKLTQEEKASFENIRIEIAVLEHLVQEKRNQVLQLLSSSLLKMGYDPKMYGLKFSAAEDKWEVKLRPDALVLPGQNRPQRRHPTGG